MSDYEVRIDAMRVEYEGDGRSLHYERDHDLTVNAQKATGGGQHAAIVLVELGVDGNELHVVRLDFGAVWDDGDSFAYDRATGEVKALTDAMEAIGVLREELAARVGAGPQ